MFPPNDSFVSTYTKQERENAIAQCSFYKNPVSQARKILTHTTQYTLRTKAKRRYPAILKIRKPYVPESPITPAVNSVHA